MRRIILFIIILLYPKFGLAQCTIEYFASLSRSGDLSDGNDCSINCDYKNLEVFIPNGFFDQKCPARTQNLILVYQDDFNATDIDHSFWIKGRDFDLSHEEGNTRCYCDSNVYVEDGYLKILANYHPDSCTGPGNAKVYTPYRMGELSSRFKFGPGKFEIRAKMPKVGNHYWTGLWLFGEGMRGKEIDIVEFQFSENQDESNRSPAFSIHSLSDYNSSCYCHNSSDCYDNNINYWDEFHTFSLEWDYSHVIWYIDGVPRRRVFFYGTFIIIPLPFFPFLPLVFFLPIDMNDHALDLLQGTHVLLKDQMIVEEPMTLKLSNGTKGLNGQFINDGVMEIDYVKIWQWTDKCNDDLVIDGCSYDWKDGEVFIGKNITVKGNGCPNIIQDFDGAGQERAVNLLFLTTEELNIESQTRSRESIWPGFEPNINHIYIPCQ